MATKSKTSKTIKKPESGELIIGSTDNNTFTDARVDGRTITHKQMAQILHDGYIRSLWEKRRNGVVAVDWTVTATRDKSGTVPPQNQAVADFISQWLTTINFDKITRQMLSAIWYGYSVAQVIWDLVDGYWVPIDIKVHDHTKFKYDTNQWVIADAMGMGAQLPEYKFWVFSAQSDTDDVPYGRGLALDLHMPWYLRKHGWKFWGEYLEKFGSPAVKGMLPEGLDIKSEDAKNLAIALESVHNLGWLVIPHGYQVEFLSDGAKGTKSNHELFVQKWEQLIPIIILGQTMTTQDGASQSQATVHKDVQDDILQADADLLCQSFNTTVIQWITHMNFANASAPTVWRTIAQADDLNARATRDVQLTTGTGYRMTQAYLSETYGIELEQNPSTVQFGEQGLRHANHLHVEAVHGTATKQDNICCPSSKCEGVGGAPSPHQTKTMAFAESDSVTADVLNKDDSIETLIDRAVAKHGGDDTIFTAFAEQLIQQYDSPQAMYDDWDTVEQHIYNDPRLTDFANALQHTLNTAFTNGAISTDKEVQ